MQLIYCFHFQRKANGRFYMQMAHVKCKYVVLSFVKSKTYSFNNKCGNSDNFSYLIVRKSCHLHELQYKAVSFLIEMENIRRKCFSNAHFYCWFNENICYSNFLLSLYEDFSISGKIWNSNITNTRFRDFIYSKFA